MIKIVRGVYGFRDSDGIVRPKTAADDPFELLPAQEERLVNLGVAEYVDSVKSAEPREIEGEKNVEEQADPGADEAPREGHAYSELSVKELREIGKEYGLTFKVGTSKAEMVKAIEDAEAAWNAEDDGDPAPAFDASEAVQ